MFASCCCYLYFGCGCFCGSLPWMQFHDLDRHDRNLRLLLVTARSAVLPEGCIKVSVGHVAFLTNSGHHWCFCEVYLDVALVCPSRRCHPTNKYIYGLPVYQNQWCGQTSSHTKQITQIIANLHAPSSFNRGGNPSCQRIDEAWEISLPLIITKWGQIQPPFPPRNPSQGFPVLLTDCSDVVQRVFPEVRFTGSDWAKSSKQWGRRCTFLEFASQKYTMFGAWFSSTRHAGLRKLDIMPWYAMAATSISQLMPDALKTWNLQKLPRTIQN